jgi:hypothetical protein
MLSTIELAIILHALGLDQYGGGESYRRRYVIGPGGDRYPDCMSLVERGMMTRQENPHVCGGVIFFVTEAGERAARAQAPERPKLTRGQERYRRYLRHDSSLSFGQWLRVYG